ncbi:hypothetical protein [Paenibacillus gallinarum]|uniref:Flagellar protein FliT n=1 Tax=Paenibacillus gallinarum TaxID=2762232 RepID=A0ABR8SZL0_9BACL|nr:hypothetical protein [Paenibacillus gallinarum]MBD7968935.1 hypothetical protein [Paenibacillus gallinarum]
MDNLIEELELITLNFISHIKEIDYEKSMVFVERRYTIIDSILAQLEHNKLTEINKKRLSLLLSYDEEILKKLENLKNEAWDWLQQRNKIKAQRSAYENPYSADSLLMDRRK